MGQVLAGMLDRVNGKQWKERQIRKITDKVFDRIKEDTGKTGLTFENLYIAVLIVYNDINKHLPGPHNDPPSREKLRSMMEVGLRNSSLNYLAFGALGVILGSCSQF